VISFDRVEVLRRIARCGRLVADPTVGMKADWDYSDAIPFAQPFGSPCGIGIVGTLLLVPSMIGVVIWFVV